MFAFVCHEEQWHMGHPEDFPNEVLGQERFLTLSARRARWLPHPQNCLLNFLSIHHLTKRKQRFSCYPSMFGWARVQKLVAELHQHSREPKQQQAAPSPLKQSNTPWKQAAPFQAAFFLLWREENEGGRNDTRNWKLFSPPTPPEADRRPHQTESSLYTWLTYWSLKPALAKPGLCS